MSVLQRARDTLPAKVRLWARNITHLFSSLGRYRKSNFQVDFTDADIGCPNSSDLECSLSGVQLIGLYVRIRRKAGFPHP